MKMRTFVFSIISIFFLCIVPSKTNAQSANPEQLKEFKELTKQRVNDLTHYIQQIGDKSLNDRLRQKSIKLAISLFDTLNYDEKGRKILKTPTVQVSRKDGTVEKIPVKTYFNNLYKLPRFPKVEITSYDLSYCSDFEKGADGNYHATAFYYQEFKGFDKNEQLLYHSKDRKAIEVTEKPNAKGMFTISFGNISVVETIQMPNE